MKNTRNLALAAILFAFLAGTITAQPSSGPKVGDLAPSLHIKEWIKGGPVDLQSNPAKNIHVVEFWATWCPPCRESIPHLTKLQKKYKDHHVVFVGVTDEDPADVKPFVKKMGDKMDYIVACDNDQQTAIAYNAEMIPTLFVVDGNGRIAFSGSPWDDEFEATLRKLTKTDGNPKNSPK